MNKKTNHRIMQSVLVATLSLSGFVGLAHAEQAEVSADVGMGYNSNVYHAPSATYIDLAKNAAPTIVPNVQGGLFVPMKIAVDYAVVEDVNLTYKFNGRFHLDTALSAADTSNHKIKLMKKMDLGEGMSLRVEGFLGSHTRLYVDRDTGTEQLSNAGLNVSNRYTYQDSGVEGELRKAISGVTLKLKGKYALLNYDEPVVISSLDHTLLQLGGFAEMKAMKNKAKFTVGYEYMTRAYDNRRSRDLNAKLGTNPFLNYTFNTISGRVSYKVNADMRVFLDGDLITRKDDFVGYNDYTKTNLKLRVLHKLNREMSVRAKVAYSKISYDRAFAFENPTLPIKTSSITTASLKGKYKWNGFGDPTLWADTTYQNVDTNDLRYKYSYTELALGGDWKF
ncbi:MAG: hypothetical protein Q9M44_03690 [Ghiorsea sp.]|nr:hypothetical protein [Ghiorsea sp.]